MHCDLRVAKSARRITMEQRMVETERGHSLRELERFASRAGLQVSDSLVEDFFPVHLKNFPPGQPVPFPLYCPLFSPREKKILFSKILARDNPYNDELREFFARRSISSAYIHKKDLARLADYLEQNARTCINSPTMSSERKTQVIYNNAEFLIERAFRDPDLGHVIDDATKWSSMVGWFLSENEITPAYLCSIFSKDYTTFTHSIQVCLLGMAFGAHLKWESEEIGEFGVGCLFHDLGKIWIDNRILQKPGILDEQEMKHIRRHPRLGYRHLKEGGLLPPRALAIVLQHHESLDGGGYPLGLSKDAIHPLARATRIVDCYDALTTRRPYKGPLSPFKALKLMHDEMWESFDLDLLKRFIQFLGK